MEPALAGLSPRQRELLEAWLPGLRLAEHHRTEDERGPVVWFN